MPSPPSSRHGTPKSSLPEQQTRLEDIEQGWWEAVVEAVHLLFTEQYSRVRCLACHMEGTWEGDTLEEFLLTASGNFDRNAVGVKLCSPDGVGMLIVA